LNDRIQGMFFKKADDHRVGRLQVLPRAGLELRIFLSNWSIGLLLKLVKVMSLKILVWISNADLLG